MAEVAQSSCIPHTTPSAGAPSAHKHSQFYCVKLHDQPFRARACLLVQARPARL